MVTQEDREAAERWGTGPVYNMDHLTQAFACHREATEARIVAWLRDWGDNRIDPTVFSEARATIHKFASDIERGAHR